MCNTGKPDILADLCKLGFIPCIMDTTAPHGIAKREDNVILFENGKDCLKCSINGFSQRLSIMYALVIEPPFETTPRILLFFLYESMTGFVTQWRTKSSRLPLPVPGSS